jgi:flagellar motility protein MotE (MotC chaperone)
MIPVRVRGFGRISILVISTLFYSTSDLATAAAAPQAESPAKEVSTQAEKPTQEATKDEKKKDEPSTESVKKKNSEEAPIKFDPLNESSEGEIVLLQELAHRSQEISAREENLKQQTLTLKAAEASMGEKLKHFDLLKQDLLKMLDKLKDKEEKQVEDLVKIYTNMKPKQAAGILNQMDMVTLKEIVKRMAKKKAALIMAAMDTKKAKDLTQTLAKESQNIS